MSTCGLLPPKDEKYTVTVRLHSETAQRFLNLEVI